MLEKGGTPTFLQAAFANQVLKLLNALVNARVTPAGAGKFVVTEQGIILDLAPTTATNQAAQIEALTKALAQTQGQVSAINASLKSATIQCAGGNVVLTLRNLP
jgi:hypothetical protein